MTHREAVALIDTPYLRDQETPMRWADLGCGSGTFTLALADLLPPGSFIEAIDIHPSIAVQTTPNGVTIRPRTADFTSLEFVRPALIPSASHPGSPVAAPSALPPGSVPASPAVTDPADLAPIPDRLWPGLRPLAYHGILMANSLHYVPDQHAFLSRLKTNALLLIEYDIDLPVARWVPYPLGFASATRALQSAGWPRIQKLGTHPSAYFVGAASPRSSSSVPFASLGNGFSDLYAALVLPDSATVRS